MMLEIIFTFIFIQDSKADATANHSKCIRSLQSQKGSLLDHALVMYFTTLAMLLRALGRFGMVVDWVVASIIHPGRWGREFGFERERKGHVR